jgi:hypothetical protein
MRKPALTLSLLKLEASAYCALLTASPIANLFGVTDGKAVGTYVEVNFRQYLSARYEFISGNPALGIDFPSEDLLVDLKVTALRQPQSSSPFRDASQKVYGLGYHLLVFIYEKLDDTTTQTAQLAIRHALFIDKSLTGDFQTTAGLIGILQRNGNLEDISAFLEERNLPLDDTGRDILAKRILEAPPQQGVITVSNALQWRLQSGHAIRLVAETSMVGLENVLE